MTGPGYGMRLVGIAGIPLHGGDQIPAGKWVKSYDPEANDGMGDIVWTDDPADALAFESPVAALRCYRLVPINRPTRVGPYGDGKTNRPLTAFTVSIEEIPS